MGTARELGRLTWATVGVVQGEVGGVPSGEGVGEGMGTQVPLSSRLPLGQVHTGPLGLSKQSHSHFLRSQGLVTVECKGERGGC